MTILKWANNASSFLADAINDVQTTLTVVSATPFPTITAGYSFYITIQDIATETLNEICLVTDITGTTFTVERGAQGTSARSWAANDLVSQLVTAGDMEAMIQSAAVLTNPTAQVGLTAVNGTSGTGMRSDGAPALYQGIAPTWTGIHTFSNHAVINSQLDIDSGSIFTKADQNSIPYGSGPAGTLNALNFSPGTTTLGTILANNVGYPTWVDPVFLFNPKLPAETGYITFSGGIILQWGKITGYTTASAYGTVTFPNAFPTDCFIVVGTGWGTDAAGQSSASTNGFSVYQTPTTTSFRWIMQNLSNLDGFYWIAIGN